MKPKLIICTIFYQDLKGLERLVSSKHNLDIIFVDGRFLGWDGPPLSTDGSREFLHSKGYEIIDAPDLIEYQKRNKYVEKAHELGYDYCLVIDSDEYIEYYNRTMIENDLLFFLDSYSHVQKYDSTSHNPYQKLYKTTARHLDNHRQSYIDTRPIFSPDNRIIHGLVTVHDPKHRSEERQRYRLDYYKNNPIR